ncbi:hypothetical protein [Modestobacter sp. KNN46-3]|uniref:hypothetical protein n=1 Tax=Modestobacter sp. KNN46-3 TaxID=2711218 RepID=UPI0013DE9FDD|nr:hypothetical protein [Modestobacter sp. KNN46-3]
MVTCPWLRDMGHRDATVTPAGTDAGVDIRRRKVVGQGGILTREKRGVWAYYALVPGAYALVPGALDTLAGVLSATGAPRGVPAVSAARA